MQICLLFLNLDFSISLIYSVPFLWTKKSQNIQIYIKMRNKKYYIICYFIIKSTADIFSYGAYKNLLLSSIFIVLIV